MKLMFLASGFYLVVPGPSAMCMFCLNVHSRHSLLCVSHSSRSKVKSHPIRLPMGPHGASSHTPCREAFFCVSQVLRHDNPKLGSRMTTALCFWGVFRRNISLAKICQAKFDGEICLSKFAGKICRRNSLAKVAGKICGGIWRNFRQKTLVKPNLIFGE